SQPASAWLSRVATRMPAMIGQGLRKRAASSNASNWVLSPISASATVTVETSSGSIHLLYEELQQRRSVTLQPGRADPGDAGQSVDVGRAGQGELAQGAVVEDHVSRYVLAARGLRAPRAKCFEARRGIVRQADECRCGGANLACAAGASARRCRRFLAQGHAAIALEHRGAGRGQSQRTVAFEIDFEQARGHQLPEHAAPLARIELVADAVGAQGLVPGLADLRGVRAAQDVDQMG